VAEGCGGRGEWEAHVELLVVSHFWLSLLR
jgi:hypothetical protein